MLDCEECTEKQSQKYLFSKKKFFIRYYWFVFDNVIKIVYNEYTKGEVHLLLQ